MLFYPQFNKYKEFVDNDNWYLPEPTDAYSIDAAIINKNTFKPNMYIINSGFMIFNKIPQWDLGKKYLIECFLNDSITHFTEQSAVNLIYLNDQCAKILEPRIFHVSTIDHFKLGNFKTADLAMRHYVGPIRYKMWQSGWKQYI